MIGRTFGRYRITSRLGEGGMGSVWLADERDLQDAESKFLRALRLQPGLPAAERGLIRMIGEKAEPWASVRVLSIAARALDRDSHDVEQLTIAVWGFTLGSMPELAIPILNRAVRLDPDNQGLTWFSVISLEWSGRPLRALAAGADYVRRFGEDLEIYTWMGEAARAIGRNREALLYFERGAELSGDSPGHYITQVLAEFYLERGDRRSFQVLADRVIPELETILRAHPDNWRIAGKLRYFHVLMGDEEKARKTWVRGAPAMTGLSWEDLAILGHPGEARELLRTLRPDTWYWAGVDSSGAFPRRTLPGINEVMKSAEYVEWRNAVDSTQVREFERYRRIVARHFPNDPDLPGPRSRWPRSST